MKINSVVVIGSGTMGSGIAALLANSGHNVVLLDVLPKNKDEERNSMAKKALEKMRKENLFTNPNNHSRVTIGNIEDDMEKVTKSDWVIEVIVENLEVKHSLYARLSRYLPSNAILSSNTSTFTLNILSDQLNSDIKSRFFITHFFNPPGQLPLLELVSPIDVNSEIKKGLIEFCEDKIGRLVVHCNDTPGFIANRIGCAWLQIFLHEAEINKVSISEIDKAVSSIISAPKTGVFGLIDLIGVDIFINILHALQSSLGKNDLLFQMTENSKTLDLLMQKNHLGRKTGIGFYKKDGGNILERNWDGNYQEKSTNNFISDFAEIIKKEDKLSLTIRNAIAKTMLYVCYVMPEIASDVYMIDTAMCAGYNWGHGPFKILDQLNKTLGSEWLISEADRLSLPIPALAVNTSKFYTDDEKCLAANDKYIPLPEAGYNISHLMETEAVIMANQSAALIDIGDKVACFAIINQNRVIDTELLYLLEQSIEYVEQNKFIGLVLFGEGNFCRGADINMFDTSNNEYSVIKDIIRYGTHVFDRLKHMTIPSIAAVVGYAVGGGCELMMHCTKTIAHCNARIGLVEPKIGLIPGWGGCREMLYRVSKTNIASTLDQMLDAKISSSADEAMTMLYLTEDDIIVMNQRKIIQYAKEQAMEIFKSGYKPKPVAIFKQGITSYTEILEKHREQNEYEHNTDNIAHSIIDLYSHMNDFENTQAEIFSRLVQTQYAKDKINNMLNHSS